MTRAAKAFRVSRFLKLTKKTAASLSLLSQTRTGMTDQIAAVPPPAEDASTVGSWLGYLGQEEAFESSGASALLRLRIDKFFKRLGQADKAWTAGKGAIAGFGFQVCGVFPIQ